MSIRTGAVALTAFRIQEPMSVASVFLNPEALLIRRFNPIDDMPELLSVGWTSFDDMLDTTFGKVHPKIGEYLAFALRIDQRKISGAVLKKHYAMALQKEEAINREAGKKYVSRERKKELKEQAKMRLLAKAEPVPASHEVVVNLSTGLVLLGCASPKVADLFSERFTATFNLTLLPLDPATLTGEPEAGRHFLTRVFSEGMSIHPPVAPAAPDAPGEPTLPGNEITLAFTDRVIVVDDKAELSGTSKNGADIAEIEAGVTAGKEVVKLGLRVEWDPDAWTMTLDHDLRFTGLRLPSGAGEDFKDDADGAFLERMFLLERAASAVHAACKDAWDQRLDSAPLAGLACAAAASVQTLASLDHL